MLEYCDYYFRWRKISHNEPSHTLPPASCSTPAETLQQRKSSLVSWRTDYRGRQSRRSSTIIYPATSSNSCRKPSHRLSLCQVSGHLLTNKRRKSCLPSIAAAKHEAVTIEEALEEISIEKQEEKQTSFMNKKQSS